MFHFIDPKFYGDQPSDAIGAAGDTVYALSSLVSHAPEEVFTERTRRGLALVLTAVVTVLDDSAETVVGMIGEPRAEGYREGMLMADKAHRKGVNSGRNSLYGDIAKLHPEWAEQHLTKVQGVARVAENPRGFDGKPRGIEPNPLSADEPLRDGETYPKLDESRPAVADAPGGSHEEPPRANGTTD